MKALKKKKILINPSDRGGCSQHRLIEPYLAMKNQDEFEFHILIGKIKESDFYKLNSYDAVVVQRALDFRLFALFDYLKKNNIKIIQDIDDDFLHVSPSNPFYKYIQGTKRLQYLKKMMKMCDYIHCSTETLSKLYSSSYNIPKERFRVFKNALRIDNLNWRNLRDKMQKDKLIIGWQGGSSHYDDLQEAFWINEILDKYPNTAFSFCSSQDLFFKTFGKFLSEKNRKERCYFIKPTQNFNSFLGIPSMCDIALTPSKICQFNEGKSWLKVLEHGYYGIPSVSSPITEYKALNDMGLNLIAKKNKKKNWVKQISSLIENEQLRKDLGNKIKQFVHKDGEIKVINEKRLEFFREILNEEV